MGQHGFFLGKSCTWIICKLPEANFYVSTPPVSLNHPFIFLLWGFFFLFSVVAGRRDLQSAGHPLALPVPWPLGMLGMYFPSLHSHNLPGFRLRQARTEWFCVGTIVQHTQIPQNEKSFCSSSSRHKILRFYLRGTFELATFQLAHFCLTPEARGRDSRPFDLTWPIQLVDPRWDVWFERAQEHALLSLQPPEV